MTERLTTWTDAEIEATVEAYLSMLEKQEADSPLSRVAIRNSLINGELSNRSVASLDYRMQNISAYLKSSNLPSLNFYKPSKNTAPLINSKIKTVINKKITTTIRYKQIFLRDALNTILKKYYDILPTDLNLIINIISDTLNHSDYKAVLQHISNSRKRDVSTLANSLNEFGLADLAILAEQSSSRIIFLDSLEELSKKPETLEQEVHKAIENNLWIFGPSYSLFSSNKTLKSQVESHTGSNYIGNYGSRRPDLLLNENLLGENLLIEFKRPSHTLNYRDYLQAITYRHELLKNITSPTEIFLIGGDISSDFPLNNREPNIKPLTLSKVISSARRQIQWQLKSN